MGKTHWRNQCLNKIWHSMLRRCYNTSAKDYKFYGGKGITICDEWLRCPADFECWALCNGFEDGLTIDRIDPLKGYTRDNCRFVTREDNAKYKSTTKLYKVGGITDSGRGWAQRC